MAETGPLNPSEHFSFDQMVVPGANPDLAQRANLAILCDPTLEAIRSLLGVPLEIVSGFDPDDPEHAEGLGCNFRVHGWPLKAALDAIYASPIPVQILSLEEGKDRSFHIHLSVPPAVTA